MATRFQHHSRISAGRRLPPCPAYEYRAILSLHICCRPGITGHALATR
ncbi:hypothetical protein ACLH17_15590 [Klebsiella pasteurii]|uniref:Uncharacterized protein n=1 Tax=Klebsiella pasteurii TaxID=2587529 RepID=A0ABD5HIP0_9ENTR|nr:MULTISPECIES: hypothetical protein [Klebsiella]MDC0691376.1 hypothetical protein [Klebsiella pasteurii]MDC0753697.1 hypothetical protein [Klebsiella pasteurii]MDQ2166890.1 hypothetical protein [Klebsiella pasteurii]MDQ2198881.1 hypothetical protein [Klebsiella pasteurii]MDQ2223610.1 hypothetical protein [Klebsiella pasteurii]